ncbi:hypothetical protein FSARC_7680 [Fusarium sarcochroum]|uniref:Uncharacterized protein n=1 Tax=Fusarium sarcochroum TaxID=1208366 RepID=A0A8H4X813_9HYPO|nr:hypothetical protein FSARC_7680 [Fusarium sarcochroum]
MSQTFKPEHLEQFYSPGWDGDSRQPVVDGKYHDPRTGELRKAEGGAYLGPPAVDIIIMSIHEDTNHCIYRAQRAFPVESLLCQIMSIVRERKLRIDSLNATQYAIRIILAHPLQSNEFSEVADEMANGLWNST